MVAGVDMHRLALLVVVAGLIAACGAGREIDRRSLRSADNCGAWPYGGLSEAGTLILANGLDDDLRTVRIESTTGHSLECALDLDHGDAHAVILPEGVYYLRVTWRHEEDESARHWFQVRDGEHTLVNAFPDGYTPSALYADTW